LYFCTSDESKLGIKKLAERERERASEQASERERAYLDAVLEVQGVGIGGKRDSNAI
jgi:hypothetical protein